MIRSKLYGDVAGRGGDAPGDAGVARVAELAQGLGPLDRGPVQQLHVVVVALVGGLQVDVDEDEADGGAARDAHLPHALGRVVVRRRVTGGGQRPLGGGQQAATAFE